LTEHNVVIKITPLQAWRGGIFC